jgi:hypothetical protein
MSQSLNIFTAAQIAAAMGLSPQAVRQQLRDVVPTDSLTIFGNKTSAWTADQLPARLREGLAIESTRQKCSIEALLRLPRRQWQPPIPFGDIASENIHDAEKLREALKPFLMDPAGVGLSAEEWKQRGADYYFRVFYPKPRISTHQWDRLFRRTQIRDNGVQNWDSIQIYLSDRLRRKPASNAVSTAAMSQNFAGLENYLRSIKVPGQPDELEKIGIWNLALTAMKQLVMAGAPEKRAARQVRQFLLTRAAFLAPTRSALWIAFKRKIAALKETGDPQAIEDGRIENGVRVEIPQADVDRLSHSAAIKNGGRIDTAWREEYPLLSENTRRHYSDSFKAPAKVHESLGREKIDALTIRHQGKRDLRRLVGSVQRDWTGIPSMHSWVVDDMTSNVEVAIKTTDGKTTLIQPQIIAVMDSASRKFVGWTISNAKAPNAGIVCDAVLDGIKTHGVPRRLGVENGFVFGKSLLVNGKEDDQGRVMVVGLGQFGCEVDHFEKMNPQSKAELEYAFHQIQCLMERHPGYAGRLQVLDAPEEFKLEKRLILAGKAEATKYRYTFDEFIAVTNKLILQYNATPQQGRLKGLSPDESFSAGMDASDPPIKFTPKLEWLLSERQLVTVGVGGVSFVHLSTRQQIKVRGGQLVNLVGEKLWAVMDRQDDSMVTFMNQNFTDTFTMEVCEKPSAREVDFAPGSGVLAKERSKIREHERAISDEYHRLKNQLGNPRIDLLAQIRGQTNALAEVQDTTTRRVIINTRIEASGEQMQAQRAKITAAKEQKTRRTAANKNKARRMEIPAVLVDDDEQSRRALELLDESPRRHTDQAELQGENNL